MVTTIPAPVAVIGLGPMGSAVADAFRGSGHRTTVWNRAARRAGKPDLGGAVVAPTLRDAVANSTVVVCCLLDSWSNREIIDSVGQTTDGKVIINLSPGTPEDARDAARWVTERGSTYLDGAILAPPAGVGKPGTRVLYGGSRKAFDA